MFNFDTQKGLEKATILKAIKKINITNIAKGCFNMASTASLRPLVSSASQFPLRFALLQ